MLKGVLPSSWYDLVASWSTILASSITPFQSCHDVRWICCWQPPAQHETLLRPCWTSTFGRTCFGLEMTIPTSTSGPCKAGLPVLQAGSLKWTLAQPGGRQHLTGRRMCTARRSSIFMNPGSFLPTMCFLSPGHHVRLTCDGCDTESLCCPFEERSSLPTHHEIQTGSTHLPRIRQQTMTCLTHNHWSNHYAVLYTITQVCTDPFSRPVV